MPISKKINPLLLLVSVTWVLLVVWNYLAQHAYLKLGLFSSLHLNFLIFWGTLYFLTLSYRLFRNKSLSWTLRFSPAILIASILAFILLLGSALMVRMGVLTLTSYSGLLVSFAAKLFTSVFACLLLLLLGTSLGKLVLCKFEFENKLDNFLLSSGVGLAIFSLGLFALAFLGLYQLLPLSLFLLICLAISFKQCWQTLQELWAKSLEIEIDLKSLKLWFYAIFLTLLSLNAISILRVAPIGWDGLAGYVNNSQLVASYGHLISGVNAYAYELLMGIGFVFSGQAMISMALASYASLLVFLLLYSLINKFSVYAFQLALLFYSIPLVVFHTQQESKIDLAALFFAGLSLLALYYWIRSKQNKFLYLAALLVGFSFSVKYTNLFLLLALLPSIAFVMYRQKLLPLKKALLSLFIFLVLAGLPFLPWALFNSWTGEQFSPSIMATGIYPGPSTNCELASDFATPTADTAAKFQSEAAKIDPVFNFSGFREEIGRYLGYTDGIGKYLLIPWTLTMNTNIQGFYVDIGFIFLALLPIALFNLRSRRELYFQSMLIFGSLYWLIWLFLARGIIWYGLPGFIALLLAMAALLEKYREQKILRRLLASLIFLSLFLGINACILGFGHPASLSYIAGVSDSEEYIDSTMPGYRKIYEEINSQQGDVYRIGTFIKYFITENDRRVFSDDQMDTLACLLQKGSAEKVKEKLQADGFRYVVLDLNIPSIDQTPEKSLTAKFNQTLYFLENYTTVIIKETGNRNKILFAEL